MLVLFIAQFIYIVLLKWINPLMTITMVSSYISLAGTGRHFHKTWVDYDKIAPAAKLAVIAGEDQLFPDHNGFDFKSIEKAWKHNQKSKKIRGASTISQQVARNVFLWQARSWVRKGLEVYFTFMIEHIWGKKRILEMYLNVAQTGDGIFGIGAAAKVYYSKPASGLNRYEAAMIAAALPNPVVYKVKPPSKITLWRQQHILTQMNNLQGDPDIEALLNEK
jgi:monofunctional biosynthetic peptidoglycan transglycosylase